MVDKSDYNLSAVVLTFDLIQTRNPGCQTGVLSEIGPLYVEFGPLTQG